ncbi:Nif3-like dinuclear metal center hexameric protein [uncultured Clostridium sp.]|uniref:Nif3-like dinuclear metal center hexameric protein n=1 Tax=uncultured Clostridium sp. TaxID=59620 RepID=UPI0025DFBB0E|nr:Nif3-like dinuclear metal center hexameric protein [uncultured Clostridium sp.]
MCKVKDIAEKIEKMAPVFLKEDYDNVGIMVGDPEQKVKKVLLTLDCTNEVIKEAEDNDCDMIIAHHPLLFRRPKSIIKGELLGDKIFKLIKNDITLYACHTNLDSAKEGINKTIVDMLGFESSEIIEPHDKNEFKDCGIGRIIRLEKSINLDDIIKRIKNNLNISSLRIARGKEEIKTIAVINGSGQDFFKMAQKMGADCIITGDTTYHFVSDYKEMGINIIDAGHFGTEFLVFLKTLEFLKDEFKEIKFINAKTSKDPYEFV